MSQENQEIVDESAQESTEQSTPQFTEIEQAAIEQGWRPKDEFHGKDHEWVDAGEFIRRGELISKISNQSHELKAVKKALQNLQEHYSKVKVTEYNRALTALKSAYKTANREGDYDRADHLEAEIEAVQQEARTFENELSQNEVQPEPQIHPELAAWMQRNPWYESQAHMRAYADDVGKRLHAAGLPPREVLKSIDEAVRKEFPQKFTNPNREKPGTVESSKTKVSSKSEDFQLTDTERRVMQSLVANGVLTKAEYISDIKKQRGVK